MSFQRIFQAKPDPAKPLQTKSLFAPRPAPFQESAQEEAAFPPIHLGQDHSAIPFKPVHPAPALGPSSISCPFTPERCPFGGACHACPPKMQMQAKLKIGQPGDRYEQEADRVAETVMRMPEPQVQRKAACAFCADKDEEDKLIQTKPLAEQITPLAQRKPGPEAEKKDEDDDALVQAKSASGIGNAQELHHPLIQSVLASPGQPLDAATRSFMEPRFGQDFSGVRVHVGGQAAESARAVNARAYTVGRDVVFGEGQYAPRSGEGKRLVAHELAHVGQQANTAVQNNNAFLLRNSNSISNTTSGLQRVQAAVAANSLETLIALQHELRQQMLTDPLHPPEDARAGLATARHWTMDRIAAIRDEYASQIEAARTGESTGTDRTGPLEVIETLMDAECTPYLDVLMEGDPQYRYEHFKTAVSEKVFAAVRLHSARRGVGQIGHRAAAEAEARSHGNLPKGAWCGAFAHTQAELGGGFDPYWATNMQGEGGIRTALAYGGVMAQTWIWAFDHWDKLQAYHASRNSLRWYEAIHRAPPRQGIQAGDLVLIDNMFGTNPDHITTAISFDGRFLTTVGGNQGTDDPSDETGVSRSGRGFDLQNNPEPNDITKVDAQNKPILDAKGNRIVDPTRGPKHVRVHGIGRWSVVDYERHIYRTSQQMPTAPPSAAELALRS